MVLNGPLLGIDVGTTHCKAAIFDECGKLLALASRPTPIARDAAGQDILPADALSACVEDMVAEVTGGVARRVSAIGVSGMAEAGLVVDRRSGQPRSDVILWYDPRPAGEARLIDEADDACHHFARSGLRPSVKHGLAKILWLRSEHPEITRQSVWLSVPDYVVFSLTGQMVTDPTLAARTFAFDIGGGGWDEPWIRNFQLNPDLFPPVQPSGSVAGRARSRTHGFTAETTVSVAGHDHVCALVGVGIGGPGRVLDSMGTAESLLGVLENARVDRAAYRSGLSIVPHVLAGRLCWLGGLPSSGRSIDWLCNVLFDTPAAYKPLNDLLSGADRVPTGIFYLPFAAPAGTAEGSGALVGLDPRHGRREIAQAVVEGTAYEIERMRRSGEALTGRATGDIAAVGGGARSLVRLQVKADVTGCRHEVPAQAEATLLGTALLAGLGSGIYRDAAEMLAVAREANPIARTVIPDEGRSAAYQSLYESGYVPLRAALAAGRAGESRSTLPDNRINSSVR